MSRSKQSLLWALVFSTIASSQSVIKTLIGGTPDDVPASVAFFNDPVGVACDANGNVYVALRPTSQVIKIGSNGIAIPYAGSGTHGFSGDGGPATAAGLSSPAGLVVDSGGNLYVADAGNNRIRKITRDGIISTVAGNGKAVFSGDGGPAIAAGLNNPEAVAVDANGNLLIADTSNSAIRVVSPNGIISTLFGWGIPSGGGDGGPVSAAGVNAPEGILVDGNGNLYISDTGNSEVRVVTPDGIIAEFAGVRNRSGFSGDNGYASNALLNRPTRLTNDQQGNVYILDRNNNRIRRVSPDGLISTYAGSGVSGGAGDQGIATGASLSPEDIAMDFHNNLFIADGANNRVREVVAASGIIMSTAGTGLSSITPRGVAVKDDTLYYSDSASHRVRALSLSSGVETVLAGTGSASFAGDSGSATAAALNTPLGLAVDQAGNVYIADSQNNRIRKVDTTGKITTVVGTGSGILTGDGGSAANATLSNPNDVAIDTAGNLYIADTGNQRIRKISSSGTISSVVGGGTDLSGTGPGTSQNINSPQGVAVEPGGTVLISDSGHNRVLRLLSDGTIQTVAGGSGAGFTGDGGPAVSAKLRTPVGLSVDPAGNIYIADTFNNAIRQIGTDGIIATVAGLPASPAGIGTPGYNGDGTPATSYELDEPTNLVLTANCTAFISDNLNRRLRQLSLGVQYTINTSPAGLTVLVDGQQATTPAFFNWLPGTQHTVSTPSSQPGAAGVQYLGSAAQTISVPCGPARATVAASVSAQYLLTLAPTLGGTISGAQSWENAGSQVSLTATPYPGYVFSGWTGACSGQGACQLTMTGPETVGATFAASNTGPPPAISTGGITTLAAFGAQNTIAPGTWIEIHGTNLSPVAAQWSGADFTGNSAPTSISGVSVVIAGKPAFLSSVSPAQINAQVPSGITPGTADVVVANGYGQSDPMSTTVAALQPALDAPFGNGYVAAYEGTAAVGSPGYPAVEPGDLIVLYGIGFGPVNPSISAGQIASVSNSLATPVTIRVGGVIAPISYAGLSIGSVGLYQFNVTVPNVSSGDQTVTATLGGVTSQALLLSVQNPSQSSSRPR